MPLYVSSLALTSITTFWLYRPVLALNSATIKEGIGSLVYPLQEAFGSRTVDRHSELAISQMKLVLRYSKYLVKPRNVNMACSILFSRNELRDLRIGKRRDSGRRELYNTMEFLSNLLIRQPTALLRHSASNMRYTIATIVSLISLGESLGISLPPLIPTIPGVTEPLTSNAPPLPVLQVPTPPLESPPFTPSNIKPKKIGYFWTGSGDKFHKGERSPNSSPFLTNANHIQDFLATYSLDDVRSILLKHSIWIPNWYRTLLALFSG